MEIEWAASALADMAAVDRNIARRVQQAVERFAESGAGNVKRLQGIDPLNFAFASATTASGFISMATRSVSSASATGAKRTDEARRCFTAIETNRIGACYYERVIQFHSA